jgi:hypothetical protein
MLLSKYELLRTPEFIGVKYELPSKFGTLRRAPVLRSYCGGRTG